MPGQSSLESLMQRPVPVPPPGSYPVPNQEHSRGDDDGLDYNFGNLSIKDKKEQIEITRNSLELLASMLNTEGKPNHTEVISAFFSPSKHILCIEYLLLIYIIISLDIYA